MPALKNQRHEKPSLAELQEVLSWKEDEGRLVWRRNVGRGRAGTIAGTVQSNGYRLIRLRKIPMLEHHIVWLFAYGEWPSQIDHIDRNPQNNKLSNLRIANHSQNGANRRRYSTNKVGLKGVTAKYGGYRAYITKDYKSIYLGKFPTPEEAHAAYLKAAEELQGEFASSS